MTPQVAFGFALLARPERWLRAGGYLSLDAGGANDAFSADCTLERCEAVRARVGVEVIALLGRRKTWTPWVGWGMGLSLAMLEETTPDGGEVIRTATMWGFDLVRLTAGLDVEIEHTNHLGLGPYVELGVGRSFASSGRVGETDVEQPFGGPGTSLWVELGLQGTWGK
jgi:hypothetical protein